MPLNAWIRPQAQCRPLPLEYTFTPLTRSDYPMLRKWLSEPHIAGWWGDPDEEIALMEEDLVSGPTDMRIVQYDNQPFAYIQDYPAHHWPAPQYAGYPKATRAIDTFLGEPDYLGKGHAAGYLRQRAHELIAAGAPFVVVDPSPENKTAIGAYRKAGFEGDQVLPCEDGDLTLIMDFKGRDAEREI